MKKRMKMYLFVGLAVGVVILGGCSSSAKEKGNGKNADADFHIIRRGFQDVRPAANELWMWQEREKDSGVKVNFEEITDAAISEKKNVLLASKDQPDAYYGMNFSNSEIAKYGSQGLFIPLEELIAKNAPNIQKIFDDYPEIKASLTQPDGHIYSLPYLNLEDNTKKLYFNKVWLDKLGTKVPTNLDEFYTVLKRFKTEDPNGNGIADEQGWYNDTTNSFGNTLERQIMGAYGLINGGDFSTSALFYLKEKELKLTVTDSRYKEVLKYEKKLYDDGLINQQTFGNVTKEKWLADGSNGVIGAYTEAGPAQFGNYQQDYVGITALEGPNGDRLAVAYPPVASPSAMMLTKANKNPAKLLKWIDYMYSDEGIILGSLGKEGVTYEEKAGKKVYKDDILNYKDGVQLGAFQWVDNVYGGGYPYVEPSYEVNANAKNQTIDEAWQWADDASHSHDFIPELIGDLPTTDEEANKVTPILNDMGKYITQMRVNFITGKTDIDSEWDTYVNQLEKLGSKEYLKIKQEQYNRYRTAMEK
ncbi:extracellular solute-binding protein [Carnobacterium gallinarum]|uniref:extracellular solute-binding protein n=1 Tax=Carnobacterium gallinarum TaxID=2749 RepID=UPI000551B8F0|nr:extracellular solute-binding protein [Carnobacterium gallinarum]